MIRRFNYTGRKKIPRSYIDIKLNSEEGLDRFSLKLNLIQLGLPNNAKVIVEANYKGLYQRFSFGTVGEFRPPDNTILTELPKTDLVYFDILIVDENSENLGLILASAKGVPVSKNEVPSDQLPILYVNPTDLGNEIWKVSFDTNEEHGPIIEINNKVPNLYDLAKSDFKFISLIYPIALRIVLEKLVTEENKDQEDHWVTHWLLFTIRILGVECPDFDDNSKDSFLIREWIDECVNSFCKKYNILEKFTTQ